MKDDLMEKFQAGKYKEIVTEWNRIEPVAVGNKDDRILVAFSLYSLGELEDCESVCGDLLPFCESRSDFFALYGSVLRKNGKVKDSEQIYKKGLALFPEDSAIANNYANLLIDRGNLIEAKKILTDLTFSSFCSCTTARLYKATSDPIHPGVKKTRAIPTEGFIYYLFYFHFLYFSHRHYNFMLWL